MNVKNGDIAIIRMTHPLEHLRGHLVNVEQFMGDCYGERDVWGFSFIGGAQPDDYGITATHGLIQDEFLRAIASGFKGEVLTTPTKEVA